MTERDPRKEAAAVARDLRRLLERERATAAGELLARGAAARPSESRTTRSAAATAPAPSVSTETPPPAAPPAARTRVNLFGELEPETPTPTPTPASVVDEIDIPDRLPPLHAPLHPGGLESRTGVVAVSQPILEVIAGEARACTLCGLCRTRTQAVPGVGSAQSGIVFVGEAPGADEDARGEPFVGRAGELLTRIIKAMDEAKLIPGVPLSRETVYICNVLKCRPPENRNPLPHEVESCAPYLKRQLAALEPRIICCLGKFAAELLVGVKGTIASLRGKVYRYGGSKLLVTYHPAACLRNPSYKRPVWEDMQRLAREYMTE